MAEDINRKMKKVYVCKICNTYLTKDSNEPVPLCCGKTMVVMDELFEDEVSELKESAGGI